MSWEAEKVDKTRGLKGESVWTRVSEGKWNVFVLDYEDPKWVESVKNDPTVWAEGLEFADIFIDRSGKEIRSPGLDFEGDTFVLRDTAI